MAHKPIELSWEFLLTRRKVTPSGCWEWVGAKLKQGYGRVKAKQKQYSIHRLAAHYKLGMPLDSESYVCHTCDNKICFNPAHLVVANNTWNQRDAARKGRSTRHNLKITDTQADEIRQLRAEGYTHKFLSEKYGIGMTQINRIARGLSHRSHKNETI